MADGSIATMNDAELDALVEQFIARGDDQVTPQHFLPVMTGIAEQGSSCMKYPDPFTGAWKLSPEDSRLAGQTPQCWIQKIVASDNDVSVQEEIVFDNGAQINVTVRARFDGQDYPVNGSPIADTIAYTRMDDLTISGTAKKAGVITVIETVSVSRDYSALTMKYSIRSREGQQASSIAVFKREPDVS